MKKVILLVALAIISMGAYAQSYQKGDKTVNIGFGLGNSLAVSGTKAGIPPVSASIDYGYTDKISLGGYLGYSSSKLDAVNYGGFSTPEFKFSYLVLGVRGAYHLFTTEKLDPYAGVMLGYNAASVSGGSYGSSVGGIVYSGVLGARYFFTNKIAAFGELGYGISYLTVGASIKL